MRLSLGIELLKCSCLAGLAQLVEHLLAKEKVEGSSLLTRSIKASEESGAFSF